MKKAFIILIVLVLILSAGPKLTASAESLYSQKVVSVVYDDSVSIHVNGSKNWSYANYAMQSFCGLLNKQDKLFITFLSDPDKPVNIDLSSDRQAAVDSIRTHSKAKGTPYSAIDNAYKVLNNVSGSNKNTQYWLVIITDGVFVKKEKSKTSNEVLINKNDLNSKLKGIADKRMPNGSKIRITYLAIGQEVISPDPAKVKNISVYPEPGDGAIVSEEKIVGVMSKIADKVSGRTRLTVNNITYLDEKTVKINSVIPLVNIAVLLQNSSATLINVKIANGSSLSMEQSSSIRYPEVAGRTTDTGLNGTVLLIGNSGTNIGAGTYILSFSEAIDKGALDIMFEPALEIQMKLYYQSGQEITNIDELLPTDSIYILYKIFESGTNKEITPDMMTVSVKYDLSYYENGIKVRSNTKSDRSMLNVQLKEADIKIVASIIIQGFEPITDFVEFNPQKPVIYSIESIDNLDNTIVRRELYTNKKAVRFFIFADGVKMTKDELTNVGAKFTTNKHKILLVVDTEILDDGTVCCAPRFNCWSFPTKGFWNWTSTWLFSCGELKVFADISGKEMEAGKVIITRESLLILSTNYIVLITILFFFYGFIFKKRFKIGAKIYYITANNVRGSIDSLSSEWKEKDLASFSPWTLVPWARNKIEVNGILFYAMPDWRVGVMPQKVGKESRRLNKKMTNEHAAVNIPVGAIKNTFVLEDPSERSKQKVQQFSSGESLLDTEDMQTCTIYKYFGNIRHAKIKDETVI